MNNPDMYIMLRSLDELSSEDGVSSFSNLEWGKKQACTCAEGSQGTYTIYKLVPVFQASLEVTTKVIEKDLSPVPEAEQSK